MDKNLTDILSKLSPFTAEEQKLADESLEMEKSHPHPPPPKPEKEEPAESLEANSSFTIIVDDNYHYMDEDHRYTAGEFDTWEEAVAKAKKMVDYDIVSAIESGSTPEEAVDLYQTFGEDPWIIGDGFIPDGDFFCAWSYAETRARELYELKQRSKKAKSQAGHVRQQSLVGSKTTPTKLAIIENAVRAVGEARDESKRGLSIQEIWDKMVEDPLISRMIKDSLIAADMDVPSENNDPFRDLKKEE